MSIVQKLTAKPWLAEQIAVDNLHEGSEFSLPSVKIGLRLFLAVATVLFSLTIIAYSDRMSLSDWRPLHEPWLLWLNTIWLILASVAFQRAQVSAGRDQIEGVQLGLFVGAIFTLAFLAGQLIVWRQLVTLGYYVDANPANAFFYLITAMHGVHLLGGLVAWARTAAKLLRGYETAQLQTSLDLCAVYWHFMLVVWLVVFGVLLFT